MMCWRQKNVQKSKFSKIWILNWTWVPFRIKHLSPQNSNQFVTNQKRFSHKIKSNNYIRVDLISVVLVPLSFQVFIAMNITRVIWNAKEKKHIFIQENPKWVCVLCKWNLFVVFFSLLLFNSGIVWVLYLWHLPWNSVDRSDIWRISASHNISTSQIFDLCYKMIIIIGLPLKKWRFAFNINVK